MTRDTRIAVFLMGELVTAVRASDSDGFRDLLSEGIEELGVKEVEELLLDWLYSFLTAEEQDRLTGWYLGVSIKTNERRTSQSKLSSIHSFRVLFRKSYAIFSSPNMPCSLTLG